MLYQIQIQQPRKLKLIILTKTNWILLYNI
jgi:hypothetical protein